MAKRTDLRSVRVEIETDRSPRIDEGVVTPHSRRPLAVGVAAVGLVALLVLVVRPDRSSTADDESVTSTTVAATSDSDALDSTDPTIAASVSPDALFIPASEIAPLQSVVRAPIGYLGLGFAPTDGRAPNIVRSVDGINWIPVAAVLADSIPRWTPEGGIERVYEKLIRTGNGYAMFMSTIERANGEEAGPSSLRIERLVSLDGASWDVDDTFDSIALADGTARVTSHDDDAFVYWVYPLRSFNGPLRDLLAEQLVDGGAPGDVCRAESQGERRLALDVCNSESRVIIEPTDLVEPARFDLVSRCAIVLSVGGSDNGSFWVSGRESSAVELGSVSSYVLPPMTTVDGTVVALDLGTAPWLDQSSCDGLVDLPQRRPPALVVWPAANRQGPVRLPTPDDVDPVALLSVRAEPVITGRQLLFMTDTTIRSIDIDTGEWVDVVTLASRMNDETAVRFSQDGSILVQLDSVRVTTTDTRTGEQRSLEDRSGGNRPGFPWIVYADNEVAFALAGNSMFKVELPAG